MNYQWISEITILQASQVVFFQHLFVVTLCRCPRQPISGLVVPGAFRPLGSSRGHPGENSAVSWASNFEPHPVGLRSSFIFLLMLLYLWSAADDRSRWTDQQQRLLRGNWCCGNPFSVQSCLVNPLTTRFPSRAASHHCSYSSFSQGRVLLWLEPAAKSA
jgi:hypothetical protein